jgi:hypothetical protein
MTDRSGKLRLVSTLCSVLLLPAILMTAYPALTASADPAGEPPVEICTDTGSDIPEDVRLVESDFTLEAALRATEMIRSWLPHLSNDNDWEAVMAVNNGQTIVRGYALKQRALNNPKDSDALSAFCKFVSEAFYYD